MDIFKSEIVFFKSDVFLSSENIIPLTRTSILKVFKNVICLQKPTSDTYESKSLGPDLKPDKVNADLARIKMSATNVLIRKRPS